MANKNIILFVLQNFKLWRLGRVFDTQFSLRNVMPIISRRVLQLIFMMGLLFSGQTWAQHFDDQYLEWKKQQQQHDERFKRSHAQLAQLQPSSANTLNHTVSQMTFAVENSHRIHLNQASADQLQQGLVGIGPKKAQAIIDYRNKIGGFKRIEQLLEVKGIGEKTLEKNKDRLSL